MTRPVADPHRRARRLLAWYPRPWRERYGAEFVEVLVADMAERPTVRGRRVDVVRHGLAARAARAGLAPPPDPAEAGRRGLAAFVVSAAVFLTVAVSLWSQLTIGWRRAAPADPATYAAVVMMTLAVAVAVALGAAAVLAAAATVAWRVVTRRGAGLAVPVGLVVAGSVVLVVGGHHVGTGWPGGGGHPWAYQRLVPGAGAAFLWASTLSVSAYWAHPGILAGLPAAQVVWMAVSPLAIAAVTAGAVTTLHRLEAPPALLRLWAALADAAAGAFGLFLIGAVAWVVGGGPGPADLFRPGSVDRVGILVLGAALLAAGRAAGVARPVRAGVARPVRP